MLRFLTNGGITKDAAVSEIMKREVLSVTPTTPTLEAIQLMRKARIGCLPVLADGKLVGVLTEENFMKIAGVLLEQKLQE